MRKTPPQLSDPTEKQRALPDTVDPQQVERLAAAKLSNVQFATALGIPLKTWLKLRRAPAIAEALSKGAQSAISNVEAALYSRAIGETVTEERYELVTIERKRNGAPTVDSKKVTQRLVLTEQRVKRLAPDVLAQIFFLKNRKPAEWKDRTEQGVEALPSMRTRELAGMSPEELAEVRRRIAARKQALLDQGKQVRQLPPAGGEDATV